MQHYEIVKVVDRARLLDPHSRQRKYATRDGRPLKQGIYAVIWPEDVETPRYDDSARYYGPYPSWKQAGDFIREASTRTPSIIL